MENTAVDKDTVARMAELARIETEPGELERLHADVARILSHAGSLRAPEGTEAAFWGGDEGGRLRPDTVAPSLERDEVLREAPEKTGDWVRVPFPGEAT